MTRPPVDLHRQAMVETEEADAEDEASDEASDEAEAEAEAPSDTEAASSMVAESPPPPPVPGHDVPAAAPPRPGGSMDATPPPPPAPYHKMVIRYTNGDRAEMEVLGPIDESMFRPSSQQGLLSFKLKDGGTRLVRSDLILDIEFRPVT